MSREMKNATDSYTVQTQIVLYSDANGSGRLFGGQLMSWMDVAGAVAARRHAGREVVTASVDKMSFTTPASTNDIVVIEARVVGVGNTSMRVEIAAYVERGGEGKRLICTSEFIYVAISEDGQPTQVPLLTENTCPRT